MPAAHTEIAQLSQADAYALLLRVMTGPRRSQAVATLGRATIEAGKKAGPLLRVLD